MMIMGNIVVNVDGDRVTSVDVRICRWLMNWHDREGAIKFALSLSPKRLIELVIAYHSAIEDV